MKTTTDAPDSVIWRDLSPDRERIHILEGTPPNSDRWRSVPSASGAPDVTRNETNTASWRKKLLKSPSPKGTQSLERGVSTYAYYNAQFVGGDDVVSGPIGSQVLNNSLDSKLSIIMQRQEEEEAERTKILTRSDSNVSVCKKFNSPVAVPAAHDSATSIEERYGLRPPEHVSKKVARHLQSQCSCSLACFIAFIRSILPIVSWLPNYKAEYIIPDIIAGFTISILHIPQGMAYGILASLKAENGLYVSFFPVLIYFLLGTSRHISIGTFAIISIMTSSAVEGMSANSVLGAVVHSNQTGSNNSVTGSDELHFSKNLEIATSLAIAVGFWQLFLGIFKLGALSVVLSDHLVSGFTTGAAIHVATSQLADLFGIHVGRYTGPLKLIYMYEEIFSQMKFTNVATVIISAVSIFVLACTKEQINDRFKDKLMMPVPVDLVVVILATVFSYLLDFKDRYGVKVMGNIPTGLPEAVPPRLDYLHQLMADGFAIAIVVFVISLSMAKLFAKKHQYTIRPNQELIALGCANVFSSFFACYPCSASLSRSLLQERAGGKTQVAGLVSCVILLLVLLVLAPYFEALPRCILAAVILVALKGMFLQVRDFIKAWRISKTDALIWMVTVLSTIFLDISYGLLAGVIFSILTVILKTILPSRTFLGNIAGTDIYLDKNRYSEAKEIKGVKIFHFGSALYFMNKEYFKNFLLTHVPIESIKNEERPCVKACSSLVHHIIIDCSSFSYIDMSGLETLSEVAKEYSAAGIAVLLAGCSAAVYDCMSRAKFFDELPNQPSVFITVHDAVKYCCSR